MRRQISDMETSFESSMCLETVDLKLVMGSNIDTSHQSPSAQPTSRFRNHRETNQLEPLKDL
jgi:hypothetical protein